MPEINTQERYQRMLSILQARGCRLTSHRLALLRLLTTTTEHPHAGRLYEDLRAQFPTVSLATVYKTLALLKDAGEVFEIDLRGDSHYDGNKPYPHPHLVCTRCGSITDGDNLLPLERLEHEIDERFGFHVSRHQLVFYGLCQSCRDGESG